nr:cytochrome c oxidase subunit 2A [Paenibacillus eucommiae]
MEKELKTVEEKEAKTQDPPLRGTFASVLLLGAFLAVTWFAVFILFLSRQ